MAAQHLMLMLRADRAGVTHQFLQNHPKLDLRGGGGSTFARKLALLGDPDDGSVVRAYIAGWRMPNDWWIDLRDFVLTRGWKLNTTDTDNDLSHYPSSLWTLDAALADTTRKPFPFKIVPVEVPE